MLTRQEYSSLRQGLVGAWCPSLGASGLTLIDRSGRNNHGTLTNMGGQDNWRASGSGVALNFDGTNDYATTACAGPLGSRSLSAWFNSSQTITANGYRWIFGYGGAASYPADVGKNFLVGLASDPTIGTNAFGVTQYGDSVGVSNVIDGKWHHGAVVNVGTVYYVFLDGVLAAQKTMTTNAVSTNVVIGRDSASLAQFFSGALDDLRIYNRALTLAEIRLLASRRGIGLSPLPDRGAALPRKLSVNVGGNWRAADSYVNVSGTWKLAQASTNVAGTWK